MESINEGAQAQLVVSSLHNDGLMKQLNAKDEKKKKKKGGREILSHGKEHRVWTDPAFRDILRERDAAKETRAAEVAQQKSLTQIRKDRAIWKAQATARKDERRKKDLEEWEEAVRLHKLKPAKGRGRAPVKPLVPPLSPIPEHLHSPEKSPNISDALSDDEDSEELYESEDGLPLEEED